MNSLTPRQIVDELNRHIIGQEEAKRTVALALRSRWRRLQLDDALRDEVLPKNILMIGPTGCGKTEIARRLARLAEAPFIKVEATKYTELGYVGRDVEQIIRDLLELAIVQVKEKMSHDVRQKAEYYAKEKILDALVGENASPETRQKFQASLEDGQLEDKEIEVQVTDSASSMPTFDVPGMPGAQMGMVNLGDVFGKALGQRTKSQKMPVADAREVLIVEEVERLLDHDKLVRDAINAVEEKGIVFIDEVDKICAREERKGADVSREGVQRDLLPLLEGTTVSTKHGMVKTDHVLFIASGAFHLSKPSDLLPELQGRLPTRVELQTLTEEDFVRILQEPDASLIKQYQALLATEGVELSFSSEGVRELARMAALINQNVENIGARRLHTVLEKVLSEISFDACDHQGTTFEITEIYVKDKVEAMAKNTDLSRFIL